MSELILVDKI